MKGYWVCIYETINNPEKLKMPTDVNPNMIANVGLESEIFERPVLP